MDYSNIQSPWEVKALLPQDNWAVYVTWIDKPQLIYWILGLKNNFQEISVQERKGLKELESWNTFKEYNSS